MNKQSICRRVTKKQFQLRRPSLSSIKFAVPPRCSYCKGSLRSTQLFDRLYAIRPLKMAQIGAILALQMRRTLQCSCSPYRTIH